MTFRSIKTPARVCQSGKSGVALRRDDGVIVYLNGVPIFTNNMPLNVPINYLTNGTP